jgi:hypothetical protein
MGDLGSPLYGSNLIPAQGKWYPRIVTQREFPPNVFNACIARDAAIWKRINECGGLMSICPGRKWKEPPWVKMPAQGKRYSRINSIPLPVVTGTDQLVTSFIVPHGYDGCIVSVVQNYTGQGFQEGSGDLTWRLKINQHYAKDLGASTVSIGSMTTPYNINSGQYILQSDDFVQYYVNLSAGGAGNLLGGRIICAVFGWWWPR